ncbi:hypothetical protein PRUB_a4298 [Pseudoalteromonas rubra]|uniref:Uncharacterized protein n=1 Tax=Pseudoalteromonas rubra TaxID=43658 RepID=A0A8T0C6H2_9GAMM|nr:hypothetical protein PRUB_a4298 [Pseudoalteromonas rubra]
MHFMNGFMASNREYVNKCYPRRYDLFYDVFSTAYFADKMGSK